MKSENSKKMRKRGEFVADKQTGAIYELGQENIFDIIAATASAFYLFCMFFLLLWLFLDIRTGRMLLLSYFFETDAPCFHSVTFRMIVYVAVGGSLGGIINGLRSILQWHSDRKSFGWRHFWKYLILPCLGAALAIIVYAIVRSGLAVVGVDLSAKTAEGDVPDSLKQIFALFSLGSLSGYGSHQVFRWLDKKVAGLFQMYSVAVTQVPDLKDQTLEDAKEALRAAKLNLGSITFVYEGPSLPGRVVDQKPEKEKTVQQASTVNLIIRKEPEEEKKDN